MQAKEIPINKIECKEYYFVVSRFITNMPQQNHQPWNVCYTMFMEEEKADIWIAEQKKFEGKPGYQTSREYKKFSVLLPI